MREDGEYLRSWEFTFEFNRSGNCYVSTCQESNEDDGLKLHFVWAIGFYKSKLIRSR